MSKKTNSTLNKCDELINRLQELKKALTTVDSKQATSNRKPVTGMGLGWSMDPSTGALHHSTQGIISTFKHPDGYYQINHGGRSVGRAMSPADAGLKIKNYVRGLRPDDTGMHNMDPMAMKSEDVEKSGYGPKGAGQYSVADNVKRKANNTGDVAGEGPNSNVKAYSSKAGQLSAKQQAAKTKFQGPASAVKQYTPEQIAAYEEAQKLKKTFEDGPWAAHAGVPNGDEEVLKLKKNNPTEVGENAMANQLANMMAGKAMLGQPPRQPTDQEMFGHLVPNEEAIAKAEAKWSNTMNWLEEASKPIASRFASQEEEEAYWASIRVTDRDDGKSGY